MLLVYVILMTLAVIALAVSVDVLGDVRAERKAAKAREKAMAPKWFSTSTIEIYHISSTGPRYVRRHAR